jgi:LmbE family N-acetylglucosaminyl deacetylase
MKTLVVAPHPDDELLGCGGTLLRRVAEGSTVAWLLMTAVTEEIGWSAERIEEREYEIDQVRQRLHIAPQHLYALGFPAAELDRLPMSTLVGHISQVFNSFAPDEVFLPHPGDVHSDHRITYKAASACTKWFRHPSIKRILTYETLSETEFNINPALGVFQPNLFVNISKYLEAKISLLKIYHSELEAHPFPRNLDAVRALSLLRGSQMGAQAAEAFQVMREFE